MLRVVFFGNSQSVFSNRHFQALLETPCELVGIADVPPAKRTSTNPASTNFPGFDESLEISPYPPQPLNL